jgi:hypothetical protein
MLLLGTFEERGLLAELFPNNGRFDGDPVSDPRDWDDRLTFRLDGFAVDRLDASACLETFDNRLSILLSNWMNLLRKHLESESKKH